MLKNLRDSRRKKRDRAMNSHHQTPSKITVVHRKTNDRFKVSEQPTQKINIKNKTKKNPPKSLYTVN